MTYMDSIFCIFKALEITSEWSNKKSFFLGREQHEVIVDDIGANTAK